MPTVSEVLGGLLDNAIKNPRTTVSSILTGTMGLIPVLLVTGWVHGKAAAILGSILVAAKMIWGSFFQKDAGFTAAIPPGASKSELVPSHEIPNDPKAIPTSGDTK